MSSLCCTRVQIRSLGVVVGGGGTTGGRINGRDNEPRVQLALIQPSNVVTDLNTTKDRAGGQHSFQFTKLLITTTDPQKTFPSIFTQDKGNSRRPHSILCIILHLVILLLHIQIYSCISNMTQAEIEAASPRSISPAITLSTPYLDLHLRETCQIEAIRYTSCF